MTCSSRREWGSLPSKGVGRVSWRHIRRLLPLAPCPRPTPRRVVVVVAAVTLTPPPTLAAAGSKAGSKGEVLVPGPPNKPKPW